MLVESLQPAGVLSQGVAERRRRSPTADALLALKVNGADLPLDHGYPARIIVPALPGVHNTKWVGQMTFSGMIRATAPRPRTCSPHLILLPIAAWALLTVLDFRAASNVVAVADRAP